MPTNNVETFGMGEDKEEHTQVNEVASAPGDLTPLRLRGLVVVQIAGTATAISATVLRSPDGAADNYSPAGPVLAGDPSSGMDVTCYEEPNRGFWKIRVDSVTGQAKVHLSGRQA